MDPDEFLSLVEEAARKLSPADPDPADYFSAGQRQVLTDVGLDLSPRHGVEVDHRARVVAAQAVLRDSALTVADTARMGPPPAACRQVVRLEGPQRVAAAGLAVHHYRRARRARGRTRRDSG